MSRYDVDKFVPLPDQELICCICTNVLDEPVESPCRHVFCKICIETWLNNKTTCPTCRDMVTKTDLKPVLPLVRNMLNKLTLMCDFMDNGCNDLISLEKYPAHINTCDYEWVLCRHPKCVKTMLRKLIKQHEEEECLCREVVCSKKCGLRIPIEEVAEHDCVAKLKEVCEARNRETELLKTELIGLRDTFEKLKQEVKNLKKEVSRQRHSSWDSSSTSSRNSDYSVIRLRSRSPRSSTSRSRSPSRSHVHRSPLISQSTDSSDTEDSSPPALTERAEQEVILHRIVAIDYADNPTATRNRTTSSPLTNDNEQDIESILYMCERCHEYEQDCRCSQYSYSYHSDLTDFSRSFSADDSNRGRQFSSEDNHSESEVHDTSTNYESRNMPASTTLLSGTEDGPSTINTYSQAVLSHDAIIDDSSDDFCPTHIARVKHNPSPDPDVGYSPTPITHPVLKKRHPKKYWSYCRYSPTQIMERTPSPGPSYSPSHPCRPTTRFSSHSAEVIETTPDKSSPSYSPTRIVQCEYAQSSEEDEVYNPSSHSPAHSEVNYSPSAFLKRQRENGKKRKFSKKTLSACWSTTDSDSSCNETNTKRYKPTPKSILCQIKIAQTSENGKLGSDIASSSSYQTAQSSKTLSDSQDNETLLELQEEILALQESDQPPSESSGGNKQDNTTQSKDSQI